MAKSTGDLPFGSEFSPSQIDLRDLIGIVAKNLSNLPKLEQSILAKYFTSHGGSDPKKKAQNQKTLAMNCRLGLQAYEIIDDTGQFTALGDELLKLMAKPADLYRRFGQHILLNLNGMRVVQCVIDMDAAGEIITLETLEKALRQRGLKIASISRHLSSMRLWLAKCNVVSEKTWHIDRLKLKDVLGTEPDEFPVLAGLSNTQRAFLRALVNTGLTKPQAADGVRDLAESIYGVDLPRKGFAGRILKPLEDAGWLAVTKTTGGRGAKTPLIAPTKKVKKEIAEPLLKQLESMVDAKLLDLLNKPLAAIIKEMDSANTYVSGLALEALAFKLMNLVGMNYVATRLKAERTGGAEVDLIFESARLVFSRWQIQCKNYKKSGAAVRVDDVAKEVGLTHTLKSSVIIIVTTGMIGEAAKKYANQIMRESNLAIVLLDGKDLTLINSEPAKIVNVFRREAEHAMQLKKLSNDEVAHD